MIHSTFFSFGSRFLWSVVSWFGQHFFSFPMINCETQVVSSWGELYMCVWLLFHYVIISFLRLFLSSWKGNQYPSLLWTVWRTLSITLIIQSHLFYHQVLCRQLLVNINCLAKPALSSLHHDDFVGTWQGLYDFLMSPFAYVLTGLFGSRLLWSIWLVWWW